MSLPPRPQVLTDSSPSTVHIGIVGGGLAGIAAAAALGQVADRFTPRLKITLYDARRQLGGRAASFRDPSSGEWIDHCQHVSLGCCTNLADLCRRANLQACFRRDKLVTFIDDRGRRFDLRATHWLPAPFHLAPSFLRFGILSLRERAGAVRALFRLARLPPEPQRDEPTIAQWLAENGQNPRAIELFWTPIIVSALSELPTTASLSAARKVFVDSLLRHRDGYQLEVPTIPLSDLYGTKLHDWLTQLGIEIRCQAALASVRHEPDIGYSLEFTSEQRATHQIVVLAVSWHSLSRLIPNLPTPPLVSDCALHRFHAAPITGVHLWFDRPLTNLPHAVLPGRTAQWVFSRPQPRLDLSPMSGPRSQSGDGAAPGKIHPLPIEHSPHYYQVVISASRDLSGQDRDHLVEQVCAELRAAFPSACEAQLLCSRVVTENAAVFSPACGLDLFRPPQRTAVPDLFLAGDWTATGWPATMEGAVRSGYLAAEAVCERLGHPQRFLQPDLPTARLSRWLFNFR